MKRLRTDDRLPPGRASVWLAATALAALATLALSGGALGGSTPLSRHTSAAPLRPQPASPDFGASVSGAPATSSNPAILAPPDAIIGESAGTVDFTVRLAEPGTDTVTVRYQTVSGTAAGNNQCNADFLPTVGTLSFAPGETEKTFPVTIFDCADQEGFETFEINFDLPTHGFIARESTMVGIVDNDTVVATPRLHVRDTVVDEAAGTAFVSVLMGGPRGQASSSPVSVDYATAGGTATAGSDYTSRSGTLTFQPGQTVKTIAIPITDDLATEEQESFTLNLSSPSGATVSGGTAVVAIGASDASGSSQPDISSAPDVIIGEGDGYADLPVTLSAPSTNVVTVRYATVNGTAGGNNQCNADFEPRTHILTFLPGETTKVARVNVYDCADAEGFETFELSLDLQTASAIARESTMIGIVDNDTVVATPRLHVRDTVIDERDGFAYVAVLMGSVAGQASNSTVTVDYSTADGTANAGSDYTSTGGTLTFAPGETAKTVAIPITDDSSTEGVENFALVLSNPNGASISDGTGTVWIGASDASSSSQPSISSGADVLVSESDGYADLPVTLSAPSTNVVTVRYATVNGTAGGNNQCNADFEPRTHILTFLPGETTKVARVNIYDCPSDAESYEQFFLHLDLEHNGAITRENSTIGIIDNDTVVAIPSLIVRDTTVDEKDGFALVSVVLGGLGRAGTSIASQSSNSTVTVDYATASGSAVSGSDYSSTSGTLVFAPHESAKTIVVPINDDNTTESAESFSVLLSDPVGATIADGTGTVAIGANDTGVSANPGIFAPPDLVVNEGDGYVDLVVSLGAPGSQAVSVSYETVNGTAAGNNQCNADFLPTGGKLTFLPGETTRLVRLHVYDCNDPEPTETFGFHLFGAVNGSVSDADSAVTIVDNDSGTATLTSIAVTPVNPSIANGGNQQFAATGSFSDSHVEDLTGSVTWSSGTPSVATVASGGLAHGVGVGTSTISATSGAITGSTTLRVTGTLSQTISFAALTNKSFGDPDFAVAATASSGLAVSFAASGNCTIFGATVHLTGVGGCTITASQPGDATYEAASPVARAFTIARASQAISFAALADRKLGSTDFTVSATASSGLAVSFAASGGHCAISANLVHLVSTGTCTITASQGGNANFGAATPVARSFTIMPKTAPPRRCTVPKVLGKPLAMAAKAITKAGCRVGKVTRVFSHAKKAGIVIGQSIRAGKRVKHGTKVDLVVSRGRRH